MSNRAHLEVTVLEDRLVPAFAITRFVPPSLIDVIPKAQSGETDQNSEPNIAVNPSNPGQAFIGAFADSGINPYFSTQNGGTFWINFQSLVHGDESLAATQSGNLYAAALENGPPNSFTVFKSSAPNNPPNLVPISTFQGTDTPDQPWVEADTVGGQDHIYATFNDLSAFPTGNTASIYYSTDGGSTFQDLVIERNGSAVVGQDGPDVRSAVSGNTVYAAFSRWTVDEGGANFLADEVVVKDTNGGIGPNPFTALGANGVVAAPNIIRRYQ